MSHHNNTSSTLSLLSLMWCLAGCPGESAEIEADMDMSMYASIDDFGMSLEDIDASLPDQPDDSMPPDLSEVQELDAFPDLTEDASPDLVDMPSVDMGPSVQGIVATFQKQQGWRSPFPELTHAPHADASTIHLEAKLRYDPEVTDSNSYFVTFVDMPTQVKLCSGTAQLSDFTLALDQTEDAGVSGIAMYQPYFVDDLLQLRVRGMGESKVILRGRLQLDVSTLPAECDVPGTLGGEVPFELELSYKTTPLTIMTYMMQKACPLMALDAPASGFDVRGQTPLIDVLEQHPFSDDREWPFPSNLDPRQASTMQITGPSFGMTDEDALIWEWLVPDIASPLELGAPANLSFQISPEADSIVSLRPVAYLAGIVNAAVPLESGGSYTVGARVSDRIFIHVADFQTLGQRSLCAAYFPETHHPDLRVEVQSATPEVCVFEPGWSSEFDNFVHSAEPNRWYMGQGSVHVISAGQCQFTSSFYLDDAVDPIHVESFDVNVSME